MIRLGGRRKNPDLMKGDNWRGDVFYGSLGILSKHGVAPVESNFSVLRLVPLGIDKHDTADIQLEPVGFHFVNVSLRGIAPRVKATIAASNTTIARVLHRFAGGIDWRHIGTSRLGLVWHTDVPYGILSGGSGWHKSPEVRHELPGGNKPHGRNR